MDAKTREKMDASFDRLVAAFKDGSLIGQVAKSASLIMSQGTRPIDRWSIRNRLLAYLAGTTDGRTYKQWQSVGRQVKKGSKSFQILGPFFVPEKDDAGKPVLDANGKPKKKMVGFRAINEFRVEDTEGEALPDYTPDELPPLMDVAESWGIDVVFTPGAGYAYGSTDGEKSITMHTHDHRTFYHELAHVAHGKVLADRGDKLKGGQQVDQEIVAEFSAAVLAEMFGTPESDHAKSYAYVAGYASKREDGDVAQALWAVLGDVEKVLNLILTEATEGPQKAAQAA